MKGSRIHGVVRELKKWKNFKGKKNEWKGNLALSFSISTMKTLRHLVIILFMLIGLSVAIGKRLEISMLVAFLAFIPLVYYITHVSFRYRFPIEPVLILFASYGFYSVVQFGRMWKDSMHRRLHQETST